MKFLSETDVNTMIKRLRVASGTTGVIKDAELKECLRLQKQNIVFDSDSEKDQNYDFQVERGCFSESDQNED